MRRFRKFYIQVKSALGIPLRGDKRFICSEIIDGFKSGAISSKSALTTSPRHDGFGSQVLCRLSVHAAAKSLGVDYFYEPFEKIVHGEGPDQEWVDRCERFFDLGNGLPRKEQCPYPKIDMIDFFRNRLLWKMPHLIEVPHMYPLCDARPELYELLIPEQRKRFYGKLNLALHVRRGDVNPNLTRERFVPTSQVLNRVLFVIDCLRDNGIDFSLNIFSNGDPEEFANFVDLGAELHLDLGALETLRCMIDSDILFMGKSTFSYVAALYHAGIVIYDEFPRKPKEAWLRFTSNTFDETHFLRVVDTRQR